MKTRPNQAMQQTAGVGKLDVGKFSSGEGRC